MKWLRRDDHLAWGVLVCLFVLAFAGIFAAGALWGRSSKDCRVSVQTDGQEELLALINDYRLQNNLEPLGFEIHLEAASQWFAQDMFDKNYFSHTDSLGRDSTTRLPDFGYPLNTWRIENLAQGQTSPHETFMDWVNSPGHQVNLLNEHVTNVGIGIAGSYWVFNAGSGEPPAPPPPPTLGPVTPAPVVLTPAPVETPCQ